MGWSSCVALLPSLDSLSASSFPLISQCAGIHCNTRFVFRLNEVSSLLILRINWLWSLLPCTLWSTDLQSVRIIVFAGSSSEEFSIVVASRRAQASALKLDESFPVGTTLEVRVPFGNLMCTPQPPFLTASSAEPSV